MCIDLQSSTQKDSRLLEWEAHYWWDASANVESNFKEFDRKSCAIQGTFFKSQEREQARSDHWDVVSYQMFVTVL